MHNALFELKYPGVLQGLSEILSINALTPNDDLEDILDAYNTTELSSSSDGELLVDAVEYSEVILEALEILQEEMV